MRSLLLASLVLLAAAGCSDAEGSPDPDGTPGNGERAAGFKPGERLMVYMKWTDLSFDACSDEPNWVESFRSLQAQLSPGYVAYGISESGRQADLLGCTTPGDLGTCSNRSPRVTFDVVDGKNLVQETVVTDPLEDLECTVVYTNTVTIEDHGTTFTETLHQDVSLRGDECAGFDADVASVSPNGRGIDGCRATFVSGGELR